MTAAAPPPRPPSTGDDGSASPSPSPASAPAPSSSASPPDGSAASSAEDEPASAEAGTEPGNEDTQPIRVAQEGTTVVIAVAGDLDVTTGEALIDAAQAALQTGPTRLDIDLRALEDFDEAGAGALVSCRELGAGLAEGLHYRTGRGPGRDALLAAYSEPDGQFDGDTPAG